jgi:hypothetical protein
MNYEVTVATGRTSVLADETRAGYEELLDLLRQEGIDGEIVEHEPGGGLGVTWEEVTLIWLAVKGLDATVGWAIEKGLDAVSERAKQWIRRKRQRQLEKDSERKARPQSVIIKSFLTGEPERRIDVDSEGNVTEYRWVKIENAEHGPSEPDQLSSERQSAILIHEHC